VFYFILFYFILAQGGMISLYSSTTGVCTTNIRTSVCGCIVYCLECVVCS